MSLRGSIVTIVHVLSIEGVLMSQEGDHMCPQVVLARVCASSSKSAKRQKDTYVECCSSAASAIFILLIMRHPLGVIGKLSGLQPRLHRFSVASHTRSCYDCQHCQQQWRKLVLNFLKHCIINVFHINVLSLYSALYKIKLH